MIKILNISFVPATIREEMIYLDLFFIHSAVCKFLFSKGQWKSLEWKPDLPNCRLSPVILDTNNSSCYGVFPFTSDKNLKRILFCLVGCRSGFTC